MRTFAVVLCSLLVLQAAAQRECATQAYIKASRTASQATAARMDAAERFIKQKSQSFTSGILGKASGENSSTIIRIPVVVHVLYNTADQNISDAQIQSGIAALNRDFRRQNSDTVNTPQRFKDLAADMEIEFHLATADSNGANTTGIIRKQTAVPAFTMDDAIKFSAQGGDDAWDSKQYLNIWLGNTRRLLGYATMPGGEANIDGVVINCTAFGTINMPAPYNLSRTAVHETGHWLGLYHIWGDAACGDDMVDDTPQQGGYTSGCPSGIRTSCGNNATGDMYMNYMDFTNDGCMNLFTYGQKERMRTLFSSGGPRHSLLTSTGLKEPWTESQTPTEDTVQSHISLNVYPNPATQNVTLQFANTEKEVAGDLYLLNATGSLIEKIRITSGIQKLNLTKLHAGVYFLQGTVNGVKVNRKIMKL